MEKHFQIILPDRTTKVVRWSITWLGIRREIIFLLSFFKRGGGIDVYFSCHVFIRMCVSEMQKYFAYQHFSISLQVVLKFVELMLHLLVLHLHTTFLVSHPIAETTKTKKQQKCWYLKRSLSFRWLGLQSSSKCLLSICIYRKWKSRWKMNYPSAYKIPRADIFRWGEGEKPRFFF